MIGELYPGEFEAMEHNGRMDALEQEPCEGWYDVPSDEMTLEQARQAVKDLRKKLAEHLDQEPCPNDISRADMLDAIGHGTTYTSQELKGIVKALPPVNPQPNKEDIHREREQAYMLGYEDSSRKYRTAQCEDTISRQWLMECVNEGWIKFDTEKDENRFIHLIRDIAPPVTPQPKTGKWIYKKDLKQFFCNKCEYPSLTDDDKYIYSMDLPNFCENCGAKMVDPQESEG